MMRKDHALGVLLQLDASLVGRDWRWNCQRSFEITIGRGLAELFFIDTNPAVKKYYDRPWANFTGTCLPMLYTLKIITDVVSCIPTRSSCRLALAQHTPTMFISHMLNSVGSEDECLELSRSLCKTDRKGSVTLSLMTICLCCVQAA